MFNLLQELLHRYRQGLRCYTDEKEAEYHHLKLKFGWYFKLTWEVI